MAPSFTASTLPPFNWALPPAASGSTRPAYTLMSPRVTRTSLVTMAAVTWMGRRRAVAGHLGDLHLRARIGQLLAVEAQQVAVEGGIAAHDVDGHGQAHGRALGRHRARHRDGVQRRRIRGIDAHGLPRAGRLARLDGAVRDARLGGAPHHVDVDRAGQRELLGQRARRAHRHHQRRRMRRQVQLALHIDRAVLDQRAGARAEFVDAHRGPTATDPPSVTATPPVTATSVLFSVALTVSALAVMALLPATATLLT